MKHILFLSFVFISLFYSCIEPYEVRSVDYDKAIVVEGRLTNLDGPHFVKLSYTRPVDIQKASPISGATVWVEDSGGYRIDFTETEPGRYECSANTTGVVGESYQLFFTTSDGEQYESDPQELFPSPPIDSIYHRYEERINSNTNKVQNGIQFLLDSHDDTNTAKFFKYDWEETYQVQSPYPSLYEFVDLTPDPDTAVLRTEQVNICYPTNKYEGIIIGTTDGLTDNRISEMDVRFISPETDHLRFAYSLLVRQYVINGAAYSFYREILANNKYNGSLFDKQLGTVVGNIHSVNNPDETVLGFFEVSGVSEKRIFVEYDDLDSRFPRPEGLYPCAPEQLISLTNKIDSMTYYVKARGYGITYAQFCDTSYVPPPPSPPCPFSSQIDMAPKYCGDCRFRGPAQKPDFWIY